ncbi:MAG TPA: hypothetical protein VHZ51_20450 [Ktedonobacteraceae bacterium]|nr:hypothetical protein [Ktedonobacteraceae bacterium]
MTIPSTFGLPQIILLILFIASIGFLISALTSLRRRPPEKYIDEDGWARYHHGRRHFRWGHGASGVVLLVIALLLLWVASLAQVYTGLNSDIKVAQVHATSVANMQHMMSVEMTLYDSSGHTTSTQTYLVSGDEWMLQGDIIKFPAWLNVLGLHSGYKLTRLEGRFDDPNLESNSKHTVITLNGGDDGFFKTTQGLPWITPFVQAAYGNATFLQPDGKTYNVVVSQSGLYPKPAM